jgi:hypothetical protein
LVYTNIGVRKMFIIMTQQKDKKGKLVASRTLVTNASLTQINQAKDRYMRKYKKGIFMYEEVDFVMKQNIHRFFRQE